jgi:hypothetical protein
MSTRRPGAPEAILVWASGGEHARVGREPDGDADLVTSRPLGYSQAGKSSPRGIYIRS